LTPKLRIASGDEVIVEMVSVSLREGKCVLLHNCIEVAVFSTTLCMLLTGRAVGVYANVLTCKCKFTVHMYTRNTAPLRRQPRFDDHWRQGTGGHFQVGSQGPGHDPCGMHSVLKRAPIAFGTESIHANISSTTSCSLLFACICMHDL